MTRRILSLFASTAALAAAVGCGSGPAPPRRSIGDPLIEVARRLEAEPTRALGEVERIDPLAGEEGLRFRLWLEALERAGAPPGRWRRLLAAGPPRAVALPARRGLAAALRRSGDPAGADRLLENALAEGDARAAEALLADGAPRSRRRAARWLAVHHPLRLRRADRALERTVVAGLSRQERLERAEAWRRAGHPRTAAAELGRLRLRGSQELRRRRLRARCELEAGRPSRALRALRGLGDPGSALLRAAAYRARAWSRFPKRAARRDFLAALKAARAAGRSGPNRPDALELVLECATETGRLDEAWAAWRGLEAAGWRGDRREWLGRRLGVHLARAGAEGPVREIEAALPQHRRCLEYWLARRSGDRRVLEGLASGPVADLYAVWSARRLGVAPPTLTPAPPLGPAAAPAAVARWLDAGLEDRALALWWEVARSRGLSAREGLALARAEAGRDHWHAAVRALRLGFPALREGRLDLVPSDALELYLPLRWREELERAAAESGIPAWRLAGQARQESLFLAHARSPKGARGLLQLLPGTARGHARALGLGRRPDLADPGVNLRLGARELARLERELAHRELALAAYNGGQARIERWSTVWRDPELLVELMPVPEMYTYVRRVTFLSLVYRDVYGIR